MTIELGSVWSPFASRIDVVVGDDEWAMQRGRDLVWTPPDEGLDRLVPGARYGFRIDGGDVLPDPRSRWQPDGPAGRSAVDDPSAYPWTASEFEAELWPRAVIYELHVGTFSTAGTFVGAIDHLDHLVDLGVSHVEVMPIAAWAGGRGWGYDGVCWWAPHPAYGSPGELRDLVDACHERGLAVLLDVVFNHLGPRGAVLDRFGPYTVPAGTPWGRAVNLDGDGSAHVRSHIVECASMWVRDYRLDGLRLDAVHAFEDRSPRHLVAELTAAIDDLATDAGRDIVVVAEWDRHDLRPVRDRRDHGWGCRAQWADDLHHAIHVTLTGESSGYYADAAASADAVAEALELVFIPRRATGAPADEDRVGGTSRSSFVVCLQNHDQIGNRAAGERITQLVSLDAAMAALPLVLLGPSVPLLFQGEEWAATTPFPYFAEHPPDLAEAVRLGRLAEFPDHDPADVPDPCDPSTARGAVLRWPERGEGVHRAVLDWYRRLLEIRRRFVSAGEPWRVIAPRPGVVVVEQTRTITACNLTERAVDDLTASGTDRRELLAAWGDASSSVACLGGRSAAIYGG